jgi:hypothetical protein
VGDKRKIYNNCGKAYKRPEIKIEKKWKINASNQTNNKI